MQEDKNIEEYLDEKYFNESKQGGWKNKLNDFLESRYFIAATVVLVAVISFCLGKISAVRDSKEAVKVTSPISGSVSSGLQNSAAAASSVSAEAQAQPQSNSEQVVASKNGTKYHYPWCAGAKQISDKNKIYFDSIEAAHAAGYTPASNCKGLK